VDYVDVRGRTKIVVKGSYQQLHPEPDVRCRSPGRGSMEEYFRHGNPEGKDRRTLFGQPHAFDSCIPRSPVRRLELMNEQGIDRTLMFPTPRQCARGAPS